MWHFAVILRHVRTTGEHCTAEVRFPNNSRNASILYFTEEPTNEEDNKYRAYDHLTTLLLFVGYSRSRHSLVSSLLDAHPHMIVADESYALRKWISNPDWKTVKSISKYQFFDTMIRNSVRSSLYMVEDPANRKKVLQTSSYLVTAFLINGREHTSDVFRYYIVYTALISVQ